MAQNKKSTTAPVSKIPPKTRLCQPPNARMVQNFLLVWLTESIDEINNEDCRTSITELRQVVNNVNTFTNVDECIDFITDIDEEKTFMIVSGTLIQIIVPLIQDMLQVNDVYIFCENTTQHEEWAQQWSKVRGVYTNISLICAALKQATHDCDQNSVSISFVKITDEVSNENLDQLDQSFMYTQILKEILLTIDFQPEHINEYLTYCREQFINNNAELKNVDKLEREYRHQKSIWWYTYNCFLYSMLNRALRTMEVDLIVRMGFFVRDLHKHIAQLYSEQFGGHHQSTPFTVYRGQGLSQTDFDQLLITKGGLLSFNNFLSTSKNRNVSLTFARRTMATSQLMGILFVMTIDPSILSTPFAAIHDVSYYQTEEEILFSMHSVFRIGEMKQIDGNHRLWQVNLTLTSDNDPQLHSLTEYIRKENLPTAKGWFRLGEVLIKLAYFDKAQQVYDILLSQTTDEDGKASIYNQLGRVKSDRGEYAEAITFFEKVLEIECKNHLANHSGLATSYHNIGLACSKMGQWSQALSYYEKALEILQKILPPDHPNLTYSNNDIGVVYSHMGEYSKALSYYEKALEIRQKTLPPNHPMLATSYSNISMVYDNMGQYSKAVSYYEKALEISRKALPPNHPELATSYNNIAAVYSKVGEYSKALQYFVTALEIWQKILSANHPSLAASYNNIGSVYDHMGEYSKALVSYEKALEIRRKTLPQNHPDLAQSYSNIGLVYTNMGEYSKALASYDKALEIRQKTLSPNHPDFAIFYNNVGGLHYKIGEYSKAASYFEKALEICQETLPANHPTLATSYNNIGGIYYTMGEYSKALSFLKRALDILQRSVPASHPMLQGVRNSIEVLKKKS